jgi:hypothetical protein
MNTDTALTRWYVPGVLDPDALAAALKVARTVAVGDSKHDVSTLFDTMNEQYGTNYDPDQFAQLARAVLHALVGLGGLEAKDPVRALQLWRSRNSSTTLAWAVGEAVSLISHEDRIQVEQGRAAERSMSGPFETDASGRV